MYILLNRKQKHLTMKTILFAICAFFLASCCKPNNVKLTQMNSATAVKMIKAWAETPPKAESRISHNFDSIPQQFWFSNDVQSKLCEEGGYTQYYIAAYIDSAKYKENKYRNKGMPTIIVAQLDTAGIAKHYYDIWDLQKNTLKVEDVNLAKPPMCPPPPCVSLKHNPASKE